MSRYFSQITSQTQAKNNLQRAVKELIKKYERKIFDSDADMQACIDEIMQKVELLNKEYPRCTPLVIHITKHDEKNCYIYEPTLFNFIFYIENSIKQQ